MCQTDAVPKSIIVEQVQALERWEKWSLVNILTIDYTTDTIEQLVTTHGKPLTSSNQVPLKNCNKIACDLVLIAVMKTIELQALKGKPLQGQQILGESHYTRSIRSMSGFRLFTSWECLKMGDPSEILVNDMKLKYVMYDARIQIN